MRDFLAYKLAPAWIFGGMVALVLVGIVLVGLALVVPAVQLFPVWYAELWLAWVAGSILAFIVAACCA